jgi:tripartite-type tricarboxylate transporter receptor subunit TctC
MITPGFVGYPTIVRRTLLATLLIAATAGTALLSAPASAQQNWPQRPVKFILPFGAGSATDVAARMMSEKLTAKWGKPVIIENKPGGDGLVAINTFVQANDDHVLLYASSASFNAHPYTQEKLPYDLERDLAPIARVTDTILSLSVASTVKANTLPELVALAKAEPGKLNATGAAGVPEFTLGYFLKTEKLDMQKIPYRDVVKAATDLGAGQIQVLLSSGAVVRPLHQAGKVKMLAVTARERVPFAPEIPTIYEAGFPSLELETTAALYGPKTMPAELRERLAKDVIEVVSDKSFSDKLIATGQAVRLGGPNELAKTLKDQATQMKKVADALGMKVGGK